jgi:hypothetical protein
MTDAAHVRDFLVNEVEALEPFGFVIAGPSGSPMHMVELRRREDGGLEVHVPGRPRTVPELTVPERSALRDRGFASEDPADPTKPWAHRANDAASAVDLAQRILAEVFGEKPGVAVDVVHGSHRAAHEAQQRLVAVRGRVEQVISRMTGSPATQDADGDYVLHMGDVHVMVAPRVAPGGPVVVRVFAITNVGVNVAPELGLFLARLNFGLMFGRFALDTDHRAIWFDESLLGDQFSDEELRFAIEVVASTADQWDDRLKQMFGGVTYQEALASQNGGAAAAVKPGQGGYL